jgi:SMODS and SLOG-associating 2TM effector domain 1/SMODS and SLOG-associating 2TM effector domain 3
MQEADFPAIFHAADSASRSAQRQFYLALACNLGALVLSSAFSVVNLASPWFQFANALVLLGSLAFTIFLAWTKPQRDWYKARALAESVKTISWRYCMRAEPFNLSMNEAQATFVHSIRGILRSNEGLPVHFGTSASAKLLTPELLRIRQLSLAERKKYYSEHRISDQLDWYRQRAIRNKKTGRIWLGLLIFVNVIAVVCAFSRVLLPAIEHYPTDVLTAAAAAVLAWIQSKKFEELSTSYALTAHEISLLDASMPTDEDETRFSLYVSDAEGAFSREHTQWQARRDNP